MTDELTELASQIHAQNVEAGWWDDWPNKPDRHSTAMMLVVTELAEAAEGARKDLMDDHLPHHTMYDVELADAAIRLLDLAGAYEIDRLGERVYHAITMTQKFMTMMDNRLKVLWEVTKMIHRSVYREDQVIYGLGGVYAAASVAGIELAPIILEKLEYNRTRKDHSRAARAAKGGKKW